MFIHDVFSAFFLEIFRWLFVDEVVFLMKTS